MSDCHSIGGVAAQVCHTGGLWDYLPSFLQRASSPIVELVVEDDRGSLFTRTANNEVRLSGLVQQQASWAGRQAAFCEAQARVIANRVELCIVAANVNHQKPVSKLTVEQRLVPRWCCLIWGQRATRGRRGAQSLQISLQRPQPHQAVSGWRRSTSGKLSREMPSAGVSADCTILRTDRPLSPC